MFKLYYMSMCAPSRAAKIILNEKGIKFHSINEPVWQRRIELNITEHLYNAFRYSVGIDIFKERMTVIPEAVEGLSTIVQTKLKWLDAQMEDKDYITGKDMKLVDIILYCALDFGAGVNQTIPTELNNINAWFEKMHNRESAKSTYHADSEKTKMRGI
mgnify:CR=1 FL=1